jgi:hypothetical protein
MTLWIIEALERYSRVEYRLRIRKNNKNKKSVLKITFSFFSQKSQVRNLEINNNLKKIKYSDF